MQPYGAALVTHLFSLPPSLWFFLCNLSLMPSLPDSHALSFLSPSALTGVPSTFTMVWTITKIHFEDYG